MPTAKRASSKTNLRSRCALAATVEARSRIGQATVVSSRRGSGVCRGRVGGRVVEAAGRLFARRRRRRCRRGQEGRPRPGRGRRGVVVRGRRRRRAVVEQVGDGRALGHRRDGPGKTSSGRDQGPELGLGGRAQVKAVVAVERVVRAVGGGGGRGRIAVVLGTRRIRGCGRGGSVVGLGFRVEDVDGASPALAIGARSVVGRAAKHGGAEAVGRLHGCGGAQGLARPTAKRSFATRCCWWRRRRGERGRRGQRRE